jgi:hypothetical protein
VATGGKSEFLQLRNVDVFPTGEITVLHAKGKATESLGATDTEAHRGLGIGQGKIGAIYRTGGHHVRVKFNSNTGDLPEMDTDTTGLYSVFLREFTGTVAEATPRKVECKLHGGAQFNAVADDTGNTFPVPTAYTGVAGTNDGESTSFKGNLYNLKVMAGMKVKLGDQVRTVISDITATSTTAVAYFYVDEPFTANSASELVSDVQYHFHNYPVEQIYDEATYNMLTMSRTLYMPIRKDYSKTIRSAAYQTTVAIGLVGTKTTGDTDAAAGDQPQVLTFPATTGASAILGYMYTDLGADATTGKYSYATLGDVKLQGSGAGHSKNIVDFMPIGTRMDISNCRTDAGVLTALANMGTVTVSHVATLVATVVGGPTTPNEQVEANTHGCEVRMYDSMTKLADVTNSIAPPLHDNYRTNWITVTDQRPLKWNAPMRSLAVTSKVLPSVSNIANRGVMAGGGASMTYYNDGTIISTTYAAASITLGGTGSFPAPSDYFFARNGFANTPVSQKLYITISGCDANPGMNREFPVTVVSTTAFTHAEDMTAAVSVTNPYQVAAAAVCVGNWVTITSRTGTLVDSKAVAIGDRIKYLEMSTSSATTDFESIAQKTYETRTVDKIWGTGMEVTMFSVKDAYTISTVNSVNTDTGRSLQDSLAWVDESGTTEASECSARGLCDTESGTCECFAGYTGLSCEMQAALNA